MDAYRSEPAVSIVTATYNRPEVLVFAIRSVLAQTFQDWELLVVGDACDERTGAAVASFGDPRIRFMNLALNFGDQSGPNNVGIRRARGSFIAFLNHDDMWFPDHLQSSLDWLHACGADVVIARTAGIEPTGDIAGGDWQTRIRGTGKAGYYDPAATTAPASGVLLSREAAAAIGPWRPGAECYLSSSQEWLFRAWRKGLMLRTMPHVTAVLVPSGLRPHSYREIDTSQHQLLEQWMGDPDSLRLHLLDRCRPDAESSFWRRAAFFMARPILRRIARLGISPQELYGRLLFHRPGAFIDALRDIRGLARLPVREPSPSELQEQYHFKNRSKQARHVIR